MYLIYNMTKVYKICLILALFICSASVAWAGINYDSLENHYLIDSVLRVDGDYIMIGDATPTGTMLGQQTTDSFFLMSGNLVFLGKWIKELIIVSIPLWGKILPTNKTTLNPTRFNSFFNSVIL